MPRAKSETTAKPKATARATRSRTATKAPAATERVLAAALALERAARDAPRAEEFQPLADHLYEFAQITPRLIESLSELPRLLAPLDATARSLQEVSETLHFAHDSFNESLLRLPRADEFEPLAEPLREFARVTPALVDSLAQVLRVARPLADAVERLDELASRLSQAPPRVPIEIGVALPGSPGEHLPGQEDAWPTAKVEALAGRLERARRAILEALASLPRDRDYGRLASQLRELASVSPSLLDWLGETRAVRAPLEGSVERLRTAAAELDAARTSLGVSADAPPSELESGGLLALADDLLLLARALRQRLETKEATPAVGALAASLDAVHDELERARRQLAKR